MKRKILFFIFICSVIDGCKPDHIVLENPSINYLPTTIGKWIIYDIDSTYYNDFDMSVNHYTFQIMERIDASFTDNEGRPTQKVLQFKRDNDTIEWTLVKAFTINLTNQRAERTEDNVRYVKLGFPISISTRWDGNAFNANGEEEYEYSNLHHPGMINGISFDSTITASNTNDFPNSIFDYVIEEQYANGVGLVYRKYINAYKTIGGNYYKGVVYYKAVHEFGN